MTLIISLVGLVVCISLSACSPGQSQQQSDAHSVAQANTKAFVKEGKPGAPVGLLSAPILNATAGQIFQTDIELTSSIQTGSLDIDMLPSKGLQLRNESARVKLDLGDKKTLKIPVTLLAVSNGRYYLNLHINMNDGSGNTSRVLAVIVQVGDVEKIIEAHKTQQTGTRDMIVLPAQESGDSSEK